MVEIKARAFQFNFPTGKRWFIHLYVPPAFGPGLAKAGDMGKKNKNTALDDTYISHKCHDLQGVKFVPFRNFWHLFTQWSRKNGGLSTLLWLDLRISVSSLILSYISFFGIHLSDVLFAYWVSFIRVWYSYPKYHIQILIIWSSQHEFLDPYKV